MDFARRDQTPPPAEINEERAKSGEQRMAEEVFPHFREPGNRPSYELTRAADLVATGLTEMRGATAPRLLLELICARVLLPGADHATEGVMARLDRLEKRAHIEGVPNQRPEGSVATRPLGGDGQGERVLGVSFAGDRRANRTAEDLVDALILVVVAVR